MLNSLMLFFGIILLIVEMCDWLIGASELSSELSYVLKSGGGLIVGLYLGELYQDSKVNFYAWMAVFCIGLGLISLDLLAFEISRMASFVMVTSAGTLIGIFFGTRIPNQNKYKTDQGQRGQIKEEVNDTH